MLQQLKGSRWNKQHTVKQGQSFWGVMPLRAGSLNEAPWRWWMASVDGEHPSVFQETGLCKSFAWHLKALFFTVFPCFKVSNLGAMGEKEQRLMLISAWILSDSSTFRAIWWLHLPPQKQNLGFNSQESWGWEAQVLGQCLQISAYFSLRDCGQECFPTMSCLFFWCPGPGLVRSCTPCWREQAALWICIFSWAASLVLMPGLHQVEIWSSEMPSRLLVLSLSGRAVTSAHRA